LQLEELKFKEAINEELIKMSKEKLTAIYSKHSTMIIDKILA